MGTSRASEEKQGLYISGLEFLLCKYVSKNNQGKISYMVLLIYTITQMALTESTAC